jgi:hypothetical protein
LREKVREEQHPGADYAQWGVRVSSTAERSSCVEDRAGAVAVEGGLLCHLFVLFFSCNNDVEGGRDATCSARDSADGGGDRAFEKVRASALLLPRDDEDDSAAVFLFVFIIIAISSGKSLQSAAATPSSLSTWKTPAMRADGACLQVTQPHFRIIFKP